jgi:hypothetical protein
MYLIRRARHVQIDMAPRLLTRGPALDAPADPRSRAREYGVPGGVPGLPTG